MTAGPPKSADDRVGLRGALSGPVLRLQSDKRLVALTRAGSGAAFAVIVERYSGPLLGYCGRLLGPDDAEDAVQQTFSNALPALRADERPVQLRPWLYRIAHNLALNALNRSGRDHEPLDEQFDGVPQPPDLVDEKERLRRLVTAIEALPERQRAAILARELEGRSHEEIAREMHATAPVVRQLVHRARIRLRNACGLLVPAPWLRWLLVADPPAPAASDRLGEAVAGGGAGAGLLKAGAVMLTTGAIATGGTGLIAGEDPFVPREHKGDVAAGANVLDTAEESPPGTNPAGASAPPRHRSSAPGGFSKRGGESSGRDEEGGSGGQGRRGGQRDAAERGGRDGGDREQALEESDGEPRLQEPHESSHESGDGGSESDSESSGETRDSGSTEPSSPSEDSGSSDGSGSSDEPSTTGEG